MEDPLVKQRQVLDALIKHGQKHGPIKGILDPVAWQRGHGLGKVEEYYR